MGRGEAAEKLSPEEDPRTSTKRGLPCAGISPRTTMRQGVDQPCGIRGSWGIYNPPKRRRHRSGMGYLQLCAGIGRRRRRRRRRPSPAGRVRVADGRQDRRGLDEGRDAPPPLEQREGHPEPAIDAKGGLRERERSAG